MEIQAAAQINHRSNYKWFPAGTARLFSLRPFQRASRVIFPKIDARAEPMVFLSTRCERLVLSDDAFSEFTVAAVIPEDVRIAQRAAIFRPPYCGVRLPVVV